VELDPDSPLVRARLQRTQLQQSVDDDSLQQLEQAVRREFPDHDPNAVIAAMQLLRAGEYQKALDAAERLRDSEGEDSALYYNLVGTAKAGLKDADAAATAFRKGLALEPDHVGLAMNLANLELQRGDQQAAAEVLEGLQAAHPGHLQSALLLARLAAQQDDTTSARQWLSNALAEHPDNAELHFELARIQNATQDLDAAETSLRRALELDPASAPARLALVRILVQSGSLDEARTLFEPLVETHGEKPDVLAQRGWFALQDGDYDNAARYYEQALNNTPSAVRPWVMEYHEALTRAGRIDDAAANLRTWLERKPGDDAARHLLATTLSDAGRDDEAIAVYRDQLERRVDDVVALNNLAWLLRERDTAQALEYARRASELAPDRGLVQGTLGAVLLDGGDTAAAVATLRQAWALAPEQPLVGYNLARALKADGQREEARQVLIEVLDRHQEFPEREEAEAMLAELTKG